ncbi:peroxisomal ATPase PEX1-like isoform X2 [Oratosquilla oratoria]|uniref:peroxisomal ATPase PEX1-like isoform X2 n=1 Tax=Oratosquilla oratoria TaxID=337810 RepID=UPI003F75C856
MVHEEFIKVATLKGSPFHHCFISIPRHWVQLVRPDTLATFLIEGKDSSVLTVSWAGDVHEGCQGEADEVRLGRRLLVGPWEEGAKVVLTQVKPPGVCEHLCVSLCTQVEWEELVLNAEVAEVSLLSQVRVVRRGQLLPLWLEGGAQVMLKVIELNPNAEVGLLQSLTRVEVLPPSESKSNYERTEKMCFTPVETEQEGSANNRNYYDNPNAQNSTENSILKSLGPLKNFLDRRRKLELTEKLTSDCDIYCRVHPVPVDESYFLPHFPVTFMHPSLVIISKKTLPTSFDQTTETFSCKLARVKSPKQLSEQCKEGLKDIKNKSDVEAIYVTVLVWENYFRSDEPVRKEDKINPFIYKGCAVVSSSLQRSYDLSISSQIILKPEDFGGRVVPHSIDVLILQAPNDMCEDVLIAKLKEKFKEWVNVNEIILNDKAIIEVPLENKNAEVLISIQDGEPLRLTKESVVMLDIRIIKTKTSVESIPKALNKTLRENHKCYIHDKQLMAKLKKSILLGLGLISPKLPSIPQNILLQGSKGRGKTTLMASLTLSLAQEPYFIHCQTLHLKSLKGKKVDILERKFQEALQEAIYRKPSLVLLEDIDYLIGVSGQSEQESGPEHEHRMHVVSVISYLVNQLMQHQQAKKNDTVGSGVVIIATCLSRAKVNRGLVAPQGHHYFPISFTMPNIEPQDSVKIFRGVVRNHFSQFFSWPKEAHGKVEIPRDHLKGKYNEPEEKHEFCCIKDSKLMRWIEGFSIMDIDHLALRAVIQAKLRQDERIKGGTFVCGTEDNQMEGDKNETKPASFSTWEVLEEDVELALVDFIPSSLRALPEKSKKDHITIQVGGLTEAQHTLRETLTWPTRYPKLFAKSSLRLRSGILLYGPPGCGKTLLANAFAQSTSIHFISVKGPELLSKYIGASEEAVRDAFERAQNARPCILFFDEFESIAPRRGHDSTGVTDRVVNQLLTQMDGVEGLTGVFLLAATSRPDLIDPALLRPGGINLQQSRLCFATQHQRAFIYSPIR